MARRDLPRLTGLSAGLITQQTSHLISNGLLTETRDENSRMGRPRQFLSLNADAGIVIGASVDWKSNLLANFINLAGKHLASVSIPYRPSQTLSDHAGEIGHALQRAIAESGLDEDRMTRIGIALPAVIDSARGEVHFSTTFPVQPTPFAAPISEITGIPVTIENDQDCRARAEHWFGRARAHDEFTFIHVSYSLDSAEFAYGVPKHGANGHNPAFGHVKTAFGPDRRSCYCGAKGCLTAYASIYGILEAAGQLEGVPFPYIDHLDPLFDAFVVRAQGGDAAALAQIDLAAAHFGQALANYLNTTNAAMVYISFEHPGYMELLERPMREVLAENTMPGILPLTRVEFIPVNPGWRWAGTAALALEQMYLEDFRNDRKRKRPARQIETMGNRAVAGPELVEGQA